MKTPVAPKNNPADQSARKTVFTGERSLLFVALLVALVMLLGPFLAERAAPTAPAPLSAKPDAHAAAAPVEHKLPSDVFAGDTWHAVTPSWPGTLRFDGGNGVVRLEPLGADPIDATYSFEETRVAEELGVQVREGTLTMKNTAGQVSIAQYRISDGKSLALQFFAGQRPETYIKLNAAEAEQEKARIRAQVSEGKLQVPGIPGQPAVALP